MKRLDGKSAIVTGACSDIGVSIVKHLIAEGANIMAADLEQEKLDSLVEILGGKVTTFAGDLSVESNVVDMVQKTCADFGAVDILINNAGGGVIRPFLEHTPETIHATLDRNLWTTIWCCQQVIPVMLKSGWGRVVNIGADSVRNGLLEHAMYNAAKGGVHGLTTGLAREFVKSGITFNTVAPCMIMTEVVRKGMAAGSERVQQFVDVIPMGRPGEVDEVASMVAYLSGPDAGFVTGQVISVNGGSAML